MWERDHASSVCRLPIATRVRTEPVARPRRADPDDPGSPRHPPAWHPADPAGRAAALHRLAGPIVARSCRASFIAMPMPRVQAAPSSPATLASTCPAPAATVLLAAPIITGRIEGTTMDDFGGARVRLPDRWADRRRHGHPD